MASQLHSVAARDSELSPKGRAFLWTFSVIMILVAGSAFLMKLVDFTTTATRDGTEALASFLIPVLNYLLVAAGFFCLFLWAYFRGHYKDVEGPKYRMLELNEQINRAESLARRHHV